VRPNTALELTPLCGRKIVAILKAGIGPTALPIYRGGAAQRQTVGPHRFNPTNSTTICAKIALVDNGCSPHSGKDRKCPLDALL